MYCEHCGREMESEARFCTSCGKVLKVKNIGILTKVCPFCKTEVSIDCEKCSVCHKLLIEKITHAIPDKKKQGSSLFVNGFLRLLKQPIGSAKKQRTWLGVLIVLFFVLLFSNSESSVSGTPSPLPPPSINIADDQIRDIPSLAPAVSLANGTVLKQNSYYFQGNGKLLIRNGTDADAVAKLIKNGVSVLTVYIKSNNQYTAQNISDGVYWLAFAHGIDWDSVTQKFKRGASSSSFEEVFDFTTTEDNEYYYYPSFEVTLNPVIGGNAETEDVPIDQFYLY